ncbi:carbohydrate kinase family protein [Spirillospora sp. CA-294931]|uniref:carbohydrate kinase family protein n=1 Tax=Spirillospora sp. CA-294931 TaxID=3240042 RepID=UPI003D908D22
MTGFPADRSVLVVGDYYADLVFGGLPRWPEPGHEIFGTSFLTLPGGAFTHQRALHRLGVPVRWAAALGDDAYSALVLRAAADEGLDTSAYRTHDRPVRNVSVALSHDGERGFVSHKDPVPPADASAAIRAHRPSCVLLTELPTGETAGPLFAAARETGAAVVLDCQHIEATLDDPAVAATLPAVEVFLPNAAEARALTGRTRLDLALDALADVVPTVVIKNGREGALAASGPQRVSVPAPAMAVVDTVGAGDCFDAGFVAGHLYGLGLRDSLRLAVLCGSLSVTGPGGTAAPTLAEIRQHTPDLTPWAS